MHNIVVATDGSPCAEHAIDVAAMLTKVGGARLLILTVGGNVSGEELRQIANAEGGTPDAVELLVNRILEQASERAGAAGVDNVQVQTAWGDLRRWLSRGENTATPLWRGGADAAGRPVVREFKRT